MKNISRFLLLGLTVALLGALVVPTAAQQPGPGEGGPIIWPNFGGDITTLNPLLINDNPSQTVANRIYPEFIGKDVVTKAYTPGNKGSMVTDWTVSDDGLVYTFKLRDDRTWSDGTPITSADLKYSYDAIVSGQIEFPVASTVTTNIASLEAPDPQTVVVTFNEFTCQALDSVYVIPMVPAHVYMQEFGTDYAKMNEAAEFNLNPTVTAGIFSFKNFRPGEQVTLVADQNYPDAELGYVIPEGYIYKNLENQTVVVESFLAGEIDLIDSIPEDRKAELRTMADNGEVQWNEGPSSGWQFMAFNLADPANPQNGLDENGDAIDQGHHPIFGDPRVRKAVVLATNHAELNEKAFFGGGIPVYSPVVAYSWAYDDQLKPYGYDPEGAAALLDEAGWTMNESTGIRECHGCLYAEEGAPLSFELLSFTGNTSVDAVTVLMKDQLAKVGIEMTLNITEFQTMIDQFLAQTFDASMLFFGGFDPNNPGELSDLFTPGGDVIGSGFNVSSYNNPEVTDLFQQARTLPGCDLEARKALFFKIQELYYEDIPWFLVNTSIVPSVFRNDLENLKIYPGAGGLTWNLDEWYKPQ